MSPSTRVEKPVGEQKRALSGPFGLAKTREEAIEQLKAFDPVRAEREDR